MPVRSALLVLAAATAAAAAGVVLAAPQPPAVTPVSAVTVPRVDPASRASVAHLYRTAMAPALRAPVRWTGAAATCDAGSPGAKAQTATLTAVNVARRLAGLDTVQFDDALSAKAQQAALVFKANGNLSHDPPSSWSCLTDGGREAAAASDIAFGGAGANAVVAFLQEPKTPDSKATTAAAQRRLVLAPAIATMGAGSTDSTSALWVRGATAAHRSDPAWVAWPAAGWFPQQLQQTGCWSLSGSAATDFSHAKVVVRTASGKRLAVTRYTPVTGWGRPTLVWRVTGLKDVSAWHARTVTVTVTGIHRGGRTVQHRWTVHLFDPMALMPAGRARITGTARSGHVLTARAAGTSPTATATAYQWLRDGSAIAGATAGRYRVTLADRGATLSVRITGTRTFYTDAVQTARRTVGR